MPGLSSGNIELPRHRQGGAPRIDAPFPRKFVDFLNSHRGSIIILDDLLANVLGCYEDRFSADQSDMADERIHSDSRGRLVEGSIQRISVGLRCVLDKFGVTLRAIRDILRSQLA